MDHDGGMVQLWALLWGIVPWSSVNRPLRATHPVWCIVWKQWALRGIGFLPLELQSLTYVTYWRCALLSSSINCFERLSEAAFHKSIGKSTTDSFRGRVDLFLYSFNAISSVTRRFLFRESDKISHSDSSLEAPSAAAWSVSEVSLAAADIESSFEEPSAAA